MRGEKSCRAAWALSMGLLLASSVGTACAQDRREALDALERERTQVFRDAQTRSAPQWSATAATPWLPPVEGESPCFSITRFELVVEPSSAPLSDSGKFSGLLQHLGSFEGACLGPQSLDALRRNLDARLVKQGYVTSSTRFAPQNLSAGVLQVRLLLGRVARIDRRGAAGGIGGNALALKVGDVLNLRAIEQTLENLARLPSQAAQFQIEAGEAANESVVAMAVEPVRSWRVGAGLDNAAARDYGRLQATAQAVWDAPLGLSDQLALSVTRTRRSEGGERFQDATMLSYSIPFGSHLLSVNASRSRHARPVQGLTMRFSENGVDASQQLRWQWTAWRNASARWHLWAGATQRASRNAVDDVELVLQRRHTRAADWGLIGWMRFAGGELSVDIDTAVPQRVGAYTDVQLDPPALARTHRVQVAWQQPLTLATLQWQYETRLAWAGVRDPARGADLQSLGSRWSVRGFDAQDLLTGQEQLTWRHDLRLANSGPVLVPGIQMQPFVGLDYGRIGAAARPGGKPGRALAGAVVGLRWGGHGLAGELAVAAPLHRPEGFAASSAVIYSSLSFNY